MQRAEYWEGIQKYGTLLSLSCFFFLYIYFFFFFNIIFIGIVGETRNTYKYRDQLRSGKSKCCGNSQDGKRIGIA